MIPPKQYYDDRHWAKYDEKTVQTIWRDRDNIKRLREVNFKQDLGCGFDEDGDLISDDWDAEKRIKRHNDGDVVAISHARQEGATRYSTNRLVYHPGPRDHPEDGLSMLEPYYMNLYKDVWLRFRNYTNYLRHHKGFRNLIWDYPFENLQGPLKWWLTTGTWSFLGPFAEHWDTRPGMNQNGYRMPDWAWADWLEDHGNKLKVSWQTMVDVYGSCREMMELARPYLPPMNGKQIIGSGVFPHVLSAALAPKPAPYSRSPKCSCQLLRHSQTWLRSLPLALQSRTRSGHWQAEKEEHLRRRWRPQAHR